MKPIHGGNIVSVARTLGCNTSDLLDLSSNLTPFGMAPGLKEMLISNLAQISFLPEADSGTLCRVFAEKYGLQPDQVLAGNGTTEFIFALPAAFHTKKALLVNPTYSDYQVACSWAGVENEDFFLTREEGFQLDFERLSTRLTGGELVFICNPNNPTSVLIPTARLHDFLKQHPKSFFVVDESYLPFTSEPSLLDLDLPENLFLLCSSSKIYGIPGLRLGFLVARKKNLACFSDRNKPWGVNSMAQISGEFLLQNADPYVHEVRSFIAEQRPEVCRALAQLPHVKVMEGAANFILCYLSGSMRARELAEKMLQKRIMIRNCESFTGLDDRYFRISLKDDAGNKKCLESLKQIMEDNQ
ncbi:MAG: aminotransferase class I/II-fold pyridoxal phosphate-dependent enzyme [Thermodesulfobacteriota bacterium]|nr:aminotransferase class I/II-fold pyridoxal phosphate-dependent enzyme [Thermodesulfobacteriota bacterium]